MPISKKKALGLIDEKITQFQRILDTVTYDTIRNTDYHEAYDGTKVLLKELFSEKEGNNFCLDLSGQFGPCVNPDVKLQNYKNHINRCISKLNVYKEQIQTFWDDPETTEHVIEPDTTKHKISGTLNQKADILLVTATKVESKAIFDVFQIATRQAPQKVLICDQIYHDIGSVNGKRIFMVQCEMGSGGLGASQQTVQKGISALFPTEVIMVGIAFGIDSKKQSIGDVLVSKQLMLYDPQRVSTKDGSPRTIPRGDRSHASPRLLRYCRDSDLYREESEFKVMFGLILSGEKLVDNLSYLQQLRDFEPEAIGGEMEGSGLYAACQDAHIDWILVKAICDWADGNKDENKDDQQKLAAKNAASFVLYVLQQVPFIGPSQKCKSVSCIGSSLIEGGHSNRGNITLNRKKTDEEYKAFLGANNMSSKRDAELGALNDASGNSDDKRREISERRVKKTLLKFNLDWKVYKNSDPYRYADEMLVSYADLFIDISAEVHNILPKKLIDDLVNLATSMKATANEIRTQDNRFSDYLSKGDEFASKARQIHGDFMHI